MGKMEDVRFMRDGGNGGKIRLFGATHAHFIGICGISMSSLAMMAKEMGLSVSGSDTDAEKSERREVLENAGIVVRHGNSPQNLPNAEDPGSVIAVYTAAVSDSDPELVVARERGMHVCSRAEFMGALTDRIPSRVGVSGMHGKSTVCGMISEIHLVAGLDPDILCGAELPSIGDAWRSGGGERIIYEACEYKDSFLSLHPTCAVITNLDAEHLDYFSGMDAIGRSFFKYADGAEQTVINIDLPETRALADRLGGRAVTVSLEDFGADYFAADVCVSRGAYSFTVIHSGEAVCRISLRVVGRHNLANALLAAATALELGIEPGFVERGLGNFCGVRRRMEYVGMLKDAVIYDDYAHHPTEIRATLATARSMGFQSVYCVFQPHTFSRTAILFDDFTRAFADADQVIFKDIYAAREVNTYGITSKALAEATPNGIYFSSDEQIVDHLKKIAAPNVMILTMGAGDIWRIRGDVTASTGV